MCCARTFHPSWFLGFSDFWYYLIHVSGYTWFVGARLLRRYYKDGSASFLGKRINHHCAVLRRSIDTTFWFPENNPLLNTLWTVLLPHGFCQFQASNFLSGNSENPIPFPSKMSASPSESSSSRGYDTPHSHADDEEIPHTDEIVAADDDEIWPCFSVLAMEIPYLRAKKKFSRLTECLSFPVILSMWSW